MQISDWINVALSILSFILAAISVILVVITVRQNHKIICESFRPYITVYGAYSHISKVDYYLVLKNFGNNAATITHFSADIDLIRLMKEPDSRRPFDGIVGTTLAPGQSIKTRIDIEHVPKECDHINFSIKYSAGKRKFDENIPFSLEYTHSALSMRTNAERKINGKPVPLSHELDIISKALQDIDSQLF